MTDAFEKQLLLEHPKKEVREVAEWAIKKIEE
jgi:hypothetical protein